MKKTIISVAQKEVWNWKEACYQDVAHLDVVDAINKRIYDASDRARKLGFCTVDTMIRPQIKVAEGKVGYKI